MSSLQATGFYYRWRRLRSTLMEGVCLLAAFTACLPLFAFLWHVIREGGPALGLQLFTQVPQPPGEAGGGLKNAIVGSLLVAGIALAIGAPLGIGAALYMSEFARPRTAAFIRFWCDVLSGVPSIVMGLLGYELFVRPAGHFSALAGAGSLAFIMLPIVVITTQEMLRLVPGSLREAGHALGIAPWRVAWSISLRAAAPGVLTGVILALARIAGETAPMLFTAFGNPYVSLRLNEPVATLPHTIFNYAISPYDDWHRLAWGGALLLVGGILSITLASRLALKLRSRAQSK
jgi:phosphate transport system permease protein